MLIETKLRDGGIISRRNKKLSYRLENRASASC